MTILNKGWRFASPYLFKPYTIQSIIMTNYCLYLDESGDHTKPDYKDSTTVNKNYFCLNGIIIADEDDKTICAEWEKIQNLYPKQNIHFLDILKGRGSFGLLKNNPSNQKIFCDLVFNFLEKSKFTIISIVIDKTKHFAKYTTPDNVYHMSLKILLERYCRFLQDHNSCGRIIIEGRETTKDQNLIDEFDNFYNNGGYYLSKDIIQKYINNDIQIKNKTHKIAGLELSDMTATIMKYFILSEYGKCSLSNNKTLCLPSDYSQNVMQIIHKKIRISPKNQIKGWGIILTPKE